MVLALLTARCYGRFCISHFLDQQIALHDNRRTANGLRLPGSLDAPHCFRADDRASTAIERGMAWRVETSSNRHYRAPAFVARLIVFSQQTLTVQKPRLNP